ncbi:hypothetical protein KM043_003472 [Ampulex compressa]|nr:hypothetical protein KM043_003472 [Ampulex compressa]
MPIKFVAHHVDWIEMTARLQAAIGRGGRARGVVKSPINPDAGPLIPGGACRSHTREKPVTSRRVTLIATTAEASSSRTSLYHGPRRTDAALLRRSAKPPLQEAIHPLCPT